MHDEHQNIPLRLDKEAVLSVVIPKLTETTQVEELRATMKESENTIITEIKKRYSSARIDRYSLPPDDNEIRMAVDTAEHADEKTQDEPRIDIGEYRQQQEHRH